MCCKCMYVFVCLLRVSSFFLATASHIFQLSGRLRNFVAALSGRATGPTFALERRQKKITAGREWRISGERETIGEQKECTEKWRACMRVYVKREGTPLSTEREGKRKREEIIFFLIKWLEKKRTSEFVTGN